MTKMLSYSGLLLTFNATPQPLPQRNSQLSVYQWGVDLGAVMNRLADDENVIE